MKLIRLMPFAAVAVAAAVAIPGGAVAEAPPLEGCNGYHIKDPAKDQTVGPILGDSPLADGTGTSPGPENMDILGVFFESRKGPDGKYVTTANLRISNLTKEIPEEIRTGVLSYQVEFNRTEDGVLFARAELKDDAWSFMYATGERVENEVNTTERPLEEVETPGQAIEGPNGLISIQLPESLSKPGTKLENVFGIVSMRSDESGYVGYGNDEAPDEGVNGGKDYTVIECQSNEPQLVTDPGATPTPDGTQPAQPAQPNPGQGKPATPAQPANKPATKAKSCKAKAKKIKNKRKRAKALKRCKKTAKRR